MPIRVFLLLLEAKAKFKGCATLHLPSRKALEQAPSDVIKRLSAIESVDLQKYTVGFEVAGNSEIPPGAARDECLKRIVLCGQRETIVGGLDQG